jgi:hypothetical protein
VLSRIRVARQALVLGALGLYAYWATSIRSFTALSYVSVALPAILVIVLSELSRRGLWSFSVRAEPPRSRGRARVPAREGESFSQRTAVSWASAASWIAVVGAAVGLEAFGLALGGRSSTWPTLSDVVDKILVLHAERWVAFGLWLGLGAMLISWARRDDAEATK